MLTTKICQKHFSETLFSTNPPILNIFVLNSRDLLVLHNLAILTRFDGLNGNHASNHIQSWAILSKKDCCDIVNALWPEKFFKSVFICF